MLKEERCEIILKSLQANKKVLLSDLSRELHVSADTVRRDIKILSAQNLCKEVRGGAIPHAPGPTVLEKEKILPAGKSNLLQKRQSVLLIKEIQLYLMVAPLPSQ